MSSSKVSTLKKYMNPIHRDRLGEQPTMHENCLAISNSARPGKTARDKANGHVPYRRNRRMYDKRTGETTKL